MSAREGQVQTSPWFSANIAKPDQRLVEETVILFHHVGKKMLGDLPPSSSVRRSGSDWRIGNQRPVVSLR
jgi:hypothetical protein